MLRYSGWLLLAVVLTAQAGNPGAKKGLDESDVVIKRGTATVTLQDVDAYVARVPKTLRQGFIDSPERIRDMLNNMLLSKQLAAQARAEHLESKPLVDAEIRLATDDVLARARMDQFMHSIKVPDLAELAHEEYLTHKDVYKTAEQVDVKHVLISTEKRSDAEAKALAEKVRKEALANPKDFDALVEKYSDDTSKAVNHGLMTDATDKKYVQEFREAAGKLTTPGEISPVVHTSFGYHVLELVSRKPPRQQTFEEVRDQLIASVREQFITNQRRDFVNQLNSQKDEINPATMDTLRDRYDADGNVKPAATADSKPAAAPAGSPAQAGTH